MRFHGFPSVEAWLDEFKRLKDYPWVVTRQTWKRGTPPSWFTADDWPDFTDSAVPYGDPVTDIRVARPDALTIVTVTGNTLTAGVATHLFSEDLSEYYGCTDPVMARIKLLDVVNYRRDGDAQIICDGGGTIGKI